MGEHNSPMFTLGLAHGERDAALIGSCPPWPPEGPEYPEANGYWMYHRGYRRVMDGAMSHVCTDECRKNRGESVA